MNLAKKVAFVTGASSGIGRALAAELARRGCRLILTALDQEQLAAVAEQLRGREGASVDFRPADITDPSSRADLIAWVRSQAGSLDLLISNAGGGRFRRFSVAAWEELRKTIALNVEAPTHLVHELLPLLKAPPEARIVIVSSGIGRLPYPGLAVYGAAKGYLTSLGETLACELRGTRVGVLVFFPGFTRTGFMDAAGMDMRRVPAFMIGSPEKVARRIARCLEHDRQWAYSDLSARLAAFVGPLLPSRLRVCILHDLFWRMPDEG
jgi:short-subunit dehydrogenase